MEINTSRVKARIRRLRTGRGISVAEMAKVAGVSEATIRRYDDPSDARDPSLIVIAKICAHYGLSIDWLVFGSTENIEKDVRFQMLLQNLSAHLPATAQAAFTEFIQGVYNLGLKLGKNGAPLVEEQTNNR